MNKWDKGLKKKIVELYWKRNYSQTQVGKKLNFPQASIHYLMKKFGIKTRTGIEAQKLAVLEGRRDLTFAPFKGRHHTLTTRKKISKAGQGEKNSNWQGGKTKEKRRIRCTLEYRLWREQVFVRDNWTCRVCGLRSHKGERTGLHPHHIKSFANYPELRFIVENGLTFCEKCHKKTISYSRKGKLEPLFKGDMELQERIKEFLKDIQWGINLKTIEGQRRLVENLYDFVMLDRVIEREKLLKRLSVKKISEIILATCEKELNETLGFMLTNDEALLFAKAIHSLVKEKLEGKG